MRNGVVYHPQFLTDDLMKETTRPMELISPKAPNFKNENVSFKNDQKIGHCLHYLFLSFVYKSFEKRVK